MLAYGQTTRNSKMPLDACGTDEDPRVKVWTLLEPDTDDTCDKKIASDEQNVVVEVGT